MTQFSDFSSPIQTTKVQVVLEYQWSTEKDLISDVEAKIDKIDDHNEPSMLNLGSIIESLASKGFELGA